MVDRALGVVWLHYLRGKVGEQGSLESNLVYPCTPEASFFSDKDHYIADSRSRKKVTTYGEFTLFHVFFWNGR